MINHHHRFLTFIFLGLLHLSCEAPPSYDTTGELLQWHPVTLTFTGPVSSEDAAENPFTDYRLEVRFFQGDQSLRIPGYFAADGEAAETGATSGDRWRVHFSPPQTGKWEFEVSFRKGQDIAVNDDPLAGEAMEFDGLRGTLEIGESNKSGRDFRGKGKLEVGDRRRYLRFAGTGEYFLKGGADSPENFLAFSDFDGTYRYQAEAREGEAAAAADIHRYQAHFGDWKEGDPTWQQGKGKAIIGALNYLASKGMNAVYFLTMNIGGDGKDVWPYTEYDERARFDCSKLDQWEIVFSHMERLGLMMHAVTQETENEKLLDGGDTGPQRKLYYRELIARFGHHNALVWNLGEENGPADFSPDGQNPAQQKAMAAHLKLHDPYQHPVVIHTHSTKGQKDEGLTELLGDPFLDGLSFQVNKREHVHDEIIKWQRLSAESGEPWLIGMDEIGFWYRGVKPDAIDPGHDTIRREVLWGSLMAGSAGVEWYFGAHYDHNDLGCEDWRSRDAMWDQTRFAMTFFQQLDYWEMDNHDELLEATGGYCLADPGEVYAVYLPSDFQGEATLELGDTQQTFTVSWFHAKKGGALQPGSIPTVSGPGRVELGSPPEIGAVTDWAVLIRKD